MADSPEIEGRTGMLRRAAIWAALGAASGLAAWGVVWAVDGEEEILRTVPGLFFGLVIGLALFGQGYARIWQAALFAAFSVAAWYAGFHIGASLGWKWSSAYYGVAASVGGLVWSAILTAAVVILFPFSRRPLLWIALLLAGGVIAGLVTEALLMSDEVFFLALWTGWYAVYAAILSTALPSRKPASPKSGQ